METVINIILGLLLVIGAGGLLLGYVLCSRHRAQQAAIKVAAASRPGSGGGGGPSEPA